MLESIAINPLRYVPLKVNSPASIRQLMPLVAKPVFRRRLFSAPNVSEFIATVNRMDCSIHQHQANTESIHFMFVVDQAVTITGKVFYITLHDIVNREDPVDLHAIAVIVGIEVVAEHDRKQRLC